MPDDLTPDPVQTVFDDLCKSFQTTLDRLAWRDIRLYVSIWIGCVYESHNVFPDTLLLLSDTLQSNIAFIVP